MSQWWRTRGCWYLFAMVVAAAVLFVIANELRSGVSSPNQLRTYSLWTFSPRTLVMSLSGFIWMLMVSEIQMQWRKLSQPGPAVETMLAARFLFALVQGWPVLLTALALLPLLAVIGQSVYPTHMHFSYHEAIISNLSAAMHALPAKVWVVALAVVSAWGMRIAWGLNWIWLGTTIVGMFLPPLHIRGDSPALPEDYLFYPLDWLLGVTLLLALLWALRSHRYNIAITLSAVVFTTASLSLFIWRWHLSSNDPLSRVLRGACLHILLGFASIPVEVSNMQSWWMEHFPKTETMLWYVAPAMGLIAQPLTLALLIPLIAWFLQRMEYSEEVATSAAHLHIPVAATL